MTEEEQIGAAQRVVAFLNDAAVVAAFARLDKSYYDEFKKEGGVTAWAKARALDDLRNELTAVVDNGVKVAADSTRRNRR